MVDCSHLVWNSVAYNLCLLDIIARLVCVVGVCSCEKALALISRRRFSVPAPVSLSCNTRILRSYMSHSVSQSFFTNADFHRLPDYLESEPQPTLSPIDLLKEARSLS